MIRHQNFTFNRRKLSYTASIMVLMMVALMLWALGLFYFVKLIPVAVEDSESFVDSIIVLTGGSNRLRKGLQLLTQKKAKKLYISGVYRGNDVQKLLQVQKYNPTEILCCISLGYEATSTRGNAMESKNWVEKNKFNSIRLVTANYHMPRSLFLFQQTMPKIKIVPHPVFPEKFKKSEWWSSSDTAILIISEYSKYIVDRTTRTIMNIFRNFNI